MNLISMQSYLLITKIIRKMNYAMFENVIFEAVVGNVCFQIIFIFIIQHMRNWKRVFALKNTHSNDYLSIIQQICILQQEDSFPTNHIHLISFLTNSYPIELTSQQEKLHFKTTNWKLMRISLPRLFLLYP